MAQPGRGSNLTDRLKQRLEERRLVGLRKYGKELTPDIEIDFLDEAIDEALDQAMYLLALKEKLSARA
ncbi:hypothetical protein LCGC14_1566570 [marine sediment metagenome]|uniref:Uncharacterized protein n=1 Tax=marine sediment metagenome TaxID=412755 RepID=A0A0F9L1W1_9ZZZZ